MKFIIETAKRYNFFILTISWAILMELMGLSLMFNLIPCFAILTYRIMSWATDPIIMGKGSHLIILCHGLGAANFQCLDIINRIQNANPNWYDEYTIAAFTCFPGCIGFFQSIPNHVVALTNNIQTRFTIEFVTKKITKISVIGISLGGLWGSEAVKALYDNLLKSNEVKAEKLITIGTPWNGIIPNEKSKRSYSLFDRIFVYGRYYGSKILPVSDGLNNRTDHGNITIYKLFNEIVKYTCSGKDLVVPNASALNTDNWESYMPITNTILDPGILSDSVYQDNISMQFRFHQFHRFIVPLDIHPMTNHLLLCHNDEVFEHLVNWYFTKAIEVHN